MKQITIVFAVCLVGALASSAEKRAKLEEYKTQCMEEIGIDAESIKTAITGQHVKRSEKLDCFSACILKKAGVINPGGSINVKAAMEDAIEDISKEELENAINKCKDTTGANDCEMAANFMECFVENTSMKIEN